MVLVISSWHNPDLNDLKWTYTRRFETCLSLFGLNLSRLCFTINFACLDKQSGAKMLFSKS